MTLGQVPKGAVKRGTQNIEEHDIVVPYLLGHAVISLFTVHRPHY
jgi:hypothetical protein